MPLYCFWRCENHSDWDEVLTQHCAGDLHVVCKACDLRCDEQSMDDAEEVAFHSVRLDRNRCAWVPIPKCECDELHAGLDPDEDSQIRVFVPCQRRLILVDALQQPCVGDRWCECFVLPWNGQMAPTDTSQPSQWTSQADTSRCSLCHGRWAL